MLGLLLRIYNFLATQGDEIKLEAAPLLKEIDAYLEEQGLAVYFDEQMGDYSLFAPQDREVMP